MDSIDSNRKSKRTKQVPSALKRLSFALKIYFPLIFLLLAIIIFQSSNCEKIHNHDDGGQHQKPTTSMYDSYLERFSDFIEAAESDDEHFSAIHQYRHQATPPISVSPLLSRDRRHQQQQADDGPSASDQEEDYSRLPGASIKPARVHHDSKIDDGFTASNNDNNNNEPDNDLFSPVFKMMNLRSLNPNDGAYDPAAAASYNSLQDRQDQAGYQNDAQAPSDASSYSDLIDSGSGNFDNQPPDESTSLLDESVSQHNSAGGVDQFDPNSIEPTQVLQTSLSSQSLAGAYNQAPSLNRRIPRLAVTAGQVWKYFVPSDTFVDEDGDLRKLRSTIVRKNDYLMAKSSGGSMIRPSNDDHHQTTESSYYSWIQYEPSSQLLYGFPTENDTGRHDVTLLVSDQFGATNQEVIEIHVRQHPSSRAFTHQFIINSILWERERFPSMVDALGELVKLISSRLFMDTRAFENFIVQYYTLNNNNYNNDSRPDAPASSQQQQQQQQRVSFNLAWSNSSLPIHPCNTSQIESLIRHLVDSQHLRADWWAGGSVDDPAAAAAGRTKLAPSLGMLRILEPDFRPESVSVQLLGSCDAQELFSSGRGGGGNSTAAMLPEVGASATPAAGQPRVRTKIGRLAWKLGELIEFRIPLETFDSDGGSLTSRDLRLHLHTIDGLPLDKDPKYGFIEFDQEAQIIYGLPFDQEQHAGQREFQLTAIHPRSGHKIRDVFIISIEPQDLTAINNRAFQMSLYFRVRTRLFGAQERVALGQKIVAAATGARNYLASGGGGATSDNNSNNNNNREASQITVTNVAKFVQANARAPQGAHGIGMDDARVFVEAATARNDYANTSPLEPAGGAQIYKFTWTNETIGYLGDCPVEVIKENILYSLEQSMLIDFAGLLGRAASPASRADEQSKNDSTRFFERLRLYFEPELDLVHLRFEPLGACINALELHDVGDSEIADMIDRAASDPYDAGMDSSLHDDASNSLIAPAQAPSPSPAPPFTTAPDLADAGNEEYWSIVVLLVLVVTLIFVIIVFFMGLHTYKINQDKRFEMQVKLAQARQNSMYLSSMILANMATANDCGTAMAPNGSAAGRNMCVVQDEEKGSRKPVILDNEKRLFAGGMLFGPSANGDSGLRSTAVQLDGQSIITTPVKPNTTLTLDSMASLAGWQPSPMMGVSMSPSTIMYANPAPNLGNNQRSMTLNRRSSAQRVMQQPSVGILNHSQSILTVASLAGHLPMIPQGNIPFVYAPVVPITSNVPYNYASLQRAHHQIDPHQGMATPSAAPVAAHDGGGGGNNLMMAANYGHEDHHVSQAPKQRLPTGMESPAHEAVNKLKSSSRSSSVSATTNSVISNPNYSPHR